jgi:hypothetical protein
MRHRFKWHVSEFPYIDLDNDTTAYCLSTPTELRIVFASAARETDYVVSRTDSVALRRHGRDGRNGKML